MALKDIEEDLTELKTVLDSVKRPQNVKWIQQQIKSLQTKIEKAKVEIPAKVEVKAPQVTKVAATTTVPGNFVTITNYSYDQEGNKVKIYLTLDEISKFCKEDQVKVTFTNESVDVKVYGYKGQDYAFAVRRLNGRIDPSKSKYTLKTNSLIITLTKEQTKHWDGLPYKDSKFDTKPQKQKDPQAGLMDLMKKMYQQGDDNMKRTIAETWSKSQNKMM